jgi:MFS family permease
VSTYYLGALFGTGAATTIGAVLLRHLDAGLQVPFVHSLSPWQALFCLSGAPGFLVAVLLLAVGEPPRHEARAKTAPQVSSGAEVRATEPAILRFMGSKKRAFFAIYVSLSMMQLVGFAMTAWSIPLLVRRVGMTTPSAGTIFGLLLIAVGVLAAVSGGILSDRLAASSRSGGRLRALLVCYVTYAPGIVLLALAHTSAVAIGALALTIFGSCMAASMMYTVVNDIVPNRLRGQAVALASMVMTLVGATLGPTAVALVTDHVFKDPGMVGYSMLIVALPCLAVGLGFTLYGLPHYSRARRDLAEATAVSG